MLTFKTKKHLFSQALGELQLAVLGPVLFQLPVALDRKRISPGHGTGGFWLGAGSKWRFFWVGNGKWNKDRGQYVEMERKWKQSAKPAVPYIHLGIPVGLKNRRRWNVASFCSLVEWSDKAAISGTFQGAPGICPNSSHGNLANNRTAGVRGEHLQPRQCKCAVLDNHNTEEDLSECDKTG